MTECERRLPKAYWKNRSTCYENAVWLTGDDKEFCYNMPVPIKKPIRKSWFPVPANWRRWRRSGWGVVSFRADFVIARCTATRQSGNVWYLAAKDFTRYRFLCFVITNEKACDLLLVSNDRTSNGIPAICPRFNRIILADWNGERDIQILTIRARMEFGYLTVYYTKD